MKILEHKFEDIVSIDNLFLSWQEFIRGKRNKMDVLEFSFRLMDNIFDLRNDLVNHTYKHGEYKQFRINDPKPRIIHKASVRDRLLHHAVYGALYPFFDKLFISDSFSCRNNKGTFRALDRFRRFAYIVSKNNTKPCWVLKCDIKKFFASVNQEILVKILQKRISDKNLINMLKEIIFSFRPNGLPLGNLTSQLFANIYLNEFDQFIKQKLRIRYYIRYADDFVIFSESRAYLESIIPELKGFLQKELRLDLHPNKIYFRKLRHGIDFLGWVNFFNSRVLRPKTVKRMIKRIEDNPSLRVLASYLGLLSHGNTKNIRDKVLRSQLTYYL